MRIKKLELNGFKSFKDRTVIHFDPGTTGIVGPNGCGKSNIVDALVWVMGEMSAKHLRGSNMSDVIFAGAEGYAPLGMAEVSLTLENDGGAFPAKYAKMSEVMITRRLYRSGESEYMINKEGARLRDVQEIFMDTGAGSKGFSIIEQGAIGKIITSKPEDRRVLIEEAAGITKFKVRKKESQRKLVSTEQNLVRLQDIIGEQKRQLGSLERQAQRAERYRKLKNELQEKELWLSSKKFLKLSGEIAQAQSELDSCQELEVGTSSHIDQMEAQLQQLRLDVAEKETQVHDSQIQVKEQTDRVRVLENEIRELEFEMEQARRDKEKTGSVMGQYQARKEALEKDLNQLVEQLNELESVANQLNSDFQEKSQLLQERQEEFKELESQLTLNRREMITTTQAQSHIEAKLNSAEEQVQETQERFESSQAVLDELKQKQSEFEKRRNEVFKSLEGQRQIQLDVMNDVENFEVNFKSLKERYEGRKKEAEEFKDQLQEVSARLYGLEDLHSNFEGFQAGVKSVMMWQKTRAQEAQVRADGSVEFQPMAEVVEVPEVYELAMEAALGSRLQSLLSSSSDECLSAVDYLKQSQSGRSSFISQDLAHSTNTSENKSIAGQEGVEALLSDVVKIPTEYQDQVSYFLKDVVIVNNIRTALQLRSDYPHKTFVTLEGDTLNPDGVITGGTAESAQSGVLKRRREIKELSQKREEWASKLSLAQVSLQKMQQQLETLEKDLENAKKKHSDQEILVVSLKKDYERAENELQNAQKACASQDNELSQIREKQLRQQEQMDLLQQSLKEILDKRDHLERLVDSLDVEWNSIRQSNEEFVAEVTHLKVESASKNTELAGLKHQHQIVERSYQDVMGQIQQMSDESNKNVEFLSENSLVIEQKRVELERGVSEAQEIEKKSAQVRDEYEQIQSTLRGIEKTVNEHNRALNESRAKINEAQLKLEQLKMKEQYLVDQVNEKYMCSLAETAPKYQDLEGDLTQVESEVEELKAKIGRIGEVNLSAIEEYDELSERYQFLSQQLNDLTESKEQLKKVIERINRICSKRFNETFEQVNERFQKVFPVLFGGGEAQLQLVAPPVTAEGKVKGETGIDIVAKPPGKKLQNVGLLSGGEKALTAVSLIFSIFLVKPSPFCLLDEVDAPLDDANVMRFNSLVQEMAKRSQIIVVTHNKHTMKVNKKLYGVTMEEKGVSKMVSVNLDVEE